MEFLVNLGTLLLMFLSFFMIVLILLQRGRGGGLAGAFGGMGSQSAFGTKAGDMFTRITVVVAIIWVVLAGGVGMAMRKVEGGRSQAIDLPSGTAKLEAGDPGSQKPNLGEGSSTPGGSKPEFSLPPIDESKGSGPVLPKTEPAAPAKPGDAATPEASKPDAPKSEPAKPEVPKADAPKGEAGKPESPKGDEPKGDAAKADPAKPEAPKGEEPKDAPKPEAKAEEPKPDAAKSDAEKPAESDKK